MIQHNTDMDHRARLTARIIAKQEADAATRRMLDRLGLPDCVASRLQVERQLADVLRERIERGEHDPVARLRLG